METFETFLGIAVALSTLVTILLLSLSYNGQKTRVASLQKSVQILVLGDIGRSPRMQYHALSIAKHGGRVQIIGYRESDIFPELLSYPSVEVLPISPPPGFLQPKSRLLFLLFGPLKVIWQALSLWFILVWKAKPTKWLLVQVACLIQGTHLLIDWHNFGYTILALKLGPNHLLVRVSKIYEKSFSRFATAHFTVTDAMLQVLRKEFQVKASIFPLHDRPPAHFKPFSPSQQTEFLHSLSITEPHADRIKSGALKVVVSSTSWTPDEDFSILLDALVSYSAAASDWRSKSDLPNLLVIITGKGPQKEYYLSRIMELKVAGKLKCVFVVTAWLSIGEYAALLASASVGISLHMSSSGVDLPMKVVDMFGAGLPVIGWSKYEAWKELVTEGVNGRGFGSSEELDHCLRDLLSGDAKELEKLKQGALKESKKRWDDVWDPIAGRLLGLWD